MNITIPEFTPSESPPSEPTTASTSALPHSEDTSPSPIRAQEFASNAIISEAAPEVAPEAAVTATAAESPARAMPNYSMHLYDDSGWKPSPKSEPDGFGDDFDSTPQATWNSRNTLESPRRAPIAIHIPTPLIALCCLLIGALAGVFVMRQRHAAQEVVLSVNGSLLKQDEMNRRVQAASASPVAQKWIDEELWLQFARQKNALPTSAQVDARYARLVQEPAFASAQRAGGKPAGAIKRALQVQMAQAELLCRGVQAGETDAQDFYRKNANPKNPTARYFSPETLIAQVIVTRSEEAIDKALAALKNGADFGQTARLGSIDASSQRGGLVTIQRGRGMYSRVPGMADALFGLEPGKQLSPRKFAGYWWIARCVSKQPERLTAYADVAEDCLLRARLAKGVPKNYANMQGEFAAFQKTARVEAFWPQVLQLQGKP